MEWLSNQRLAPLDYPKGCNTHRITRLVSLLVSLGIFIGIGGCSTHAKRPMSSSITTLTSESYTRSTKLVDYSELLSVAGLLPIPAVGVMFYNPRNGVIESFRSSDPGPVHSIGIVRNGEKRNSFRLIGQTITPSPKAVIKASNAIEVLGEMSAQAAANLVRQAALRVQLERLRVDAAGAVKEMANLAAKEENESQDVKGLDEKLEVIKQRTSTLDRELAVINSQVKNDALTIANLKQKAREATSVPGLVVVRWTAQSNAGATAGASSDNLASSDNADLASLSLASQSEQSGIAVLGGVRISLLFFAKDYIEMLNSVDDEGFRKLMRDVGVTTSVIQTTAIAYTSNLNYEATLDAQARAEAKLLGYSNPQDLLKMVDGVRLNSYLHNVSSYSNKGQIVGHDWFQDDVEFSEVKCSESNRKGCEFGAMRSYAKFLTEPNSQPLSEYDGWVTLQSVQARLSSGAFDALFEKSFEDRKRDKQDGKPEKVVASTP